MLSFQLFYAFEWLKVFVWRASRLGLISSMRLDDRKKIQPVRSTWSTLISQLNANILPLWAVNNGCKTNRER